MIAIDVWRLKEWAMHTGRFQEGVDSPKWVQWKTRLRCALNKAADIEICKDECQLRPEDADQYKVYEFKTRQGERASGSLFLCCFQNLFPSLFDKPAHLDNSTIERKRCLHLITHVWWECVL